MRWARALGVAALAIVAVAGLAAPAGAHAAYKSSNPPDDGQVSSPPSDVTATFTEPLAGGSFLQVTDPCGARVDGGDVRIVGYDMSVSMNGSAAGRYTVYYKAHSTLDPHVTDGTFGFTAASGAACPGEEEAAGGEVIAQRPSGRGSSGSGSVGSGPNSSRVDRPSASTERSGAQAAAGSGRDARDRGGERPTRSDRSGATGGEDAAELAAAEEDEEEAPSVWEGIRLEPFLTGLLLAAIIGAAGGKMYAGIMGPRA